MKPLRDVCYKIMATIVLLCHGLISAGNAVLAADHVLKTTGRFKLKYPDDPAMDLGKQNNTQQFFLS